jgi:hypothetical protein
MPSRWERLFETKPIPILEHFVEEIAKLLTAELRKWPLEIEELDLQSDAGQRYASLFEPGAPRPAPAVFNEAFLLVRWELERELDAYDDYMRNERYLERGLAPTDKPALLFISQWLLEQLLGVAEATRGRVKRKHLVDCVERIERKLSGSSILLG